MKLRSLAHQGIEQRRLSSVGFPTNGYLTVEGGTGTPMDLYSMKPLGPTQQLTIICGIYES
jgi:hypothetical protein